MLEWKAIYDGIAAESERYEYLLGGESIGGHHNVWLDVHIERKSDGRVFEREWREKVDLDPRMFCQSFEDGYVVVFPWEWKKVQR